MISDRISIDLPPQNGYHHSNAQVTFLLKNGSENVLCCANIQWLSAA